MGVLELLTDELVRSLPEDPRDAFISIVRACDRYIEEASSDLPDDGDSWRYVESAQYDAMSAIIGAAKQYGIVEIIDSQLPVRKSFGHDVFMEFKVEVDHYIAQWILQRGLQNRRDTLTIPVKVRDRLRSHIAAMKKLVDDGSIPESKRATLQKKLRDFEGALEKDRVSIAAIGMVVIGISAAADATTLIDSPTWGKLTSNIVAALGEAKAVDDATRHIPASDPPLVALPPRKAQSREDFAVDLDDEIPF